jgi:ubiquinone/menaquinone biosynthesis C-methylase UbiE
MNYWDELMGTDEGAASYMASYGEGPGCATRLTLGELIQDGQTVLDVGVGPGWNLDHFLEFGPEISRYRGTDYSPRFIKVCNERLAELKAKYGERLLPGGAEFVLGDVRKLDEADDSFDVVVMQDVLEHTNGYEAPIHEALRVAKSRVIVSFWKASFQDDNNSDNQINDDGHDGYGATYNRGDFEKFLDTLGYRWGTVTTGPEANRWHRFYYIQVEES